MNKDQVKGSVKEAGGKLQEKAGEMVGNDKQELKGKEKQVDGRTEKTVGNVKDTFDK